MKNWKCLSLSLFNVGAFGPSVRVFSQKKSAHFRPFLCPTWLRDFCQIAQLNKLFHPEKKTLSESNSSSKQATYKTGASVGMIRSHETCLNGLNFLPCFLWLISYENSKIISPSVKTPAVRTSEICINFGSTPQKPGMLPRGHIKV